MKTFGAMLRARREQLDMSSSLVANALGISAVYYGDIERGNRPPFPPGDVYELLAKTLCLPKRDLVLAAHYGRLPEGCPPAVADAVACLLTIGGDMTPDEVTAVMAIVNMARTRVEAGDADSETGGS